MWMLIGLSAVLFNGAFFFPHQVGFLILFFPLPIFFVVQNRAYAWLKGFVWGLFIFMPHFWWLLMMMLEHSEGSVVVSVCVYLYASFYLALTCGLWFWAAALLNVWCRKVNLGLQRTLRMVSFITITIFQWFFFIDYAVRPMGFEGYPFISPLIPLASYRWFLKSIALGMYLLGMQPPAPQDVSYIYCPPVMSFDSKVPWRTNAQIVGQKIQDALRAVRDERVFGPHQPVLYISPETMFAFPLNSYPEMIGTWTSVLPQGANWLMASTLVHNGRYFATVFLLRDGVTEALYLKKILTPFTEKMPPYWSALDVLRQPFLKRSVEYSDDCKELGVDFFDIGESLRVIPRLCMEFFFSSRNECEKLRDPHKNTWIFFFTSEEWFDFYFRQNFALLVRLRSQILGLPVVFCGNLACYNIVPERV
jgi:apolipoprotein N-acyltransferase